MPFQLIYTCALLKSVCCDQLADIAKQSTERNAKHDITGILICKDGSVMQVLEGEKSAVEKLYSKIEQDARVKNPLVLIRRNIETREFPNWSMGYRNANKAGLAFDTSTTSLPVALPKNTSPEVRTFTQTFARVNGLLAS